MIIGYILISLLFSIFIYSISVSIYNDRLHRFTYIFKTLEHDWTVYDAVNGNAQEGINLLQHVTKYGGLPIVFYGFSRSMKCKHCGFATSYCHCGYCHSSKCQKVRITESTKLFIRKS